MLLRPATFFDIKNIVSLGRKYYEEIPHITYAYEDDFVAGALCESFTKDYNFFHLAIDGDEIVGMLWGYAFPALPWTPTLSAVDILFYVKPEYRGTRVAIKLVKAWESWAIEQKCTEVALGTSSGINTARTVRFYERMGFSLVGQQLTKEL